ncbi:MAG: tRNA pseudouridine(55) synthase TruB [candidate division Zixibacteria bacterium]|nr:tRNA pseudouridine(55) synthase TruB [candidate division Zixibacteria bacterium]
MLKNPSLKTSRECLTVHNSGILCIHKPVGWTSYDVIRYVKKIWGIKQIGHTGTLDPLAEGVLILCSGAATKLALIFSDLPKSYHAAFKLGLKTDTDDITGEILEENKDICFSDSEINDTLQRFIGEIEQVPPRFSAVKMQGKPAYAHARKGKDFKLKSRKVFVHSIESVRIDLPEIELKIHCSSGTYIRSIARDLGELLGVGGTLQKLRRLSIGHIELKDCYTPEQLERFDAPPFADIGYITSCLDKIDVDEIAMQKILNGIELKYIFNQDSQLTASGDDKALLMHQNRPLALIARRHPESTEFKYLRVIPEWK